MICPECGKKVFRTGEMQPSMPPVWYLACINKHVQRLRTDSPPPLDKEINRMWRQAIDNKTINEWKLV